MSKKLAEVTKYMWQKKEDESFISLKGHSRQILVKSRSVGVAVAKALVEHYHITIKELSEDV